MRQPGVESNLARAAGLFGESAALLDELAEEDAARVTPGSSGSHTALCKLSDARARNLLRYLLVRAGALPPATDRLVETLRQMHNAKDGARQVLDGWAVCAWRDAFWLEPEVAHAPKERVWRGESQLAWAGGVLSFRVGNGPDALRLKSDGSARIATRRGGERLRPYAQGPSRAFKQLAQEAAIPPWQRELLPCLWQADELVWIAGLGSSADSRCAEGEPGWLVAWQSA
jgi:tRNA(Ile)-lysidine synthase